ncbi:hypothetical protein [Citrobacter phage Tr1]|nr:hypothetical protein [Citrobacter phage Tr1]
MKENAIIVASYLLTGLTEEDIVHVRAHLERYAAMFIEEDGDDSVFSVDVISDSIYPCLALTVDGDAWERFARNHDAVEFSMVTNQENILGVLH